jgi:tellurite resistance protein
MATRWVAYPPDLKERLLEVAIAVAWADGEIEEEEGRMLGSAIEASELTPAVVGRLTAAVETGLRIEDVEIGEIPRKHHEDVLVFASTLMVADGVIRPEERSLWRYLLDGLSSERGRGPSWQSHLRRVLPGW